MDIEDLNRVECVYCIERFNGGMHVLLTCDMMEHELLICDVMRHDSLTLQT